MPVAAVQVMVAALTQFVREPLTDRPSPASGPSESGTAPLESGEHTKARPAVPDAATLDNLELDSDVRYEFSGVLGEGGMGAVNLCFDRRLQRPVAMKRMRTRTATRGQRDLFLREALAQAKLEHPAIVPTYDVGSDADGSLYFTMRRVQGETLEAIVADLKRGRPEAVKQYGRHRLLAAFGSVCLAVHYAHMRGVYHCDIKPANIMMGAFGEVYVLDWGIAMHESEAAAYPGGGTPGYMAPEQLRGEAIDARTDVYALGATLFELLTLESLHQGKRAQVLEQTLAGKPVRPSERAPRREVAPELDAICMKATALNPADRYESPRALFEELDGYLAGDRDLFLRQEMSRKHAEGARDAAKRAAREGTLDARREALRAVGKALAFDPSNEEALRTFVTLLGEPPRKMPREARAALHGAERSFQRARAIAGAIGLFTWVLLLPVFHLAGIGTPDALLANALTWGAAGCVLLAVAIKPRKDGTSHLAEPVVASLAVSTSTLVFHSLALTATFATVLALGFTLAMHRRHRFVPAVLTSATVAVPWALGTFGVVNPELVFGAQAATAGTHLLLLSSVMCIIVAALFSARLRQKLDDVHRRTHLMTWHLRQLLPDAATRSDADGH